MVKRLLGQAGIELVTRISGLLLTAIALQLLADATREFRLTQAITDVKRALLFDAYDGRFNMAPFALLARMAHDLPLPS